MSVQERETVEREAAEYSPAVAHLVAPDTCCQQPGCAGDGSRCGGAALDGASKALQARVAGTPVWTLCQIALVPSRDSRPLPTCTACLAVLEDLTGAPDDSDCREG